MQRRVNSFATVYKAIRALMFKTAAGVAAADFAQPADRANAGRLIAELLFCLRERSQLEAMYMLPVLSRTDAAVAQGLESDQRQIEALALELESLVEGLLWHQGDPAAALTLQPVIASLLHGLVAEQLLHMERQEHDADAALRRHLGDDELQRLGMLMQTTLAPQRQVHWKALVCAAVSAQESRVWLASLRSFHISATAEDQAAQQIFSKPAMSNNQEMSR